MNTKETGKQESNSDKPKSEELVRRTEVKNSPFTIIEIDGKCFGTMGTYRVTEEGTFEDVKKELESITWNRIVQVMLILLETHKSVK